MPSGPECDQLRGSKAEGKEMRLVSKVAVHVWSAGQQQQQRERERGERERERGTRDGQQRKDAKSGDQEKTTVYVLGGVRECSATFKKISRDDKRKDEGRKRENVYCFVCPSQSGSLPDSL